MVVGLRLSASTQAPDNHACRMEMVVSHELGGMRWKVKAFCSSAVEAPPAGNCN